MRRRDVDIVNTILLILIVASILVLAGVINVSLNEGISVPTISWGIGGVSVIIISSVLRVIYNKKKSSKVSDTQQNKEG